MSTNKHFELSIKGYLARLVFPLFFILSFLLSGQNAFGQQIDENSHFVFRQLDNAILEFWMESDQTKRGTQDLISGILTDWKRVRSEIKNGKYKHFDKNGFIEDQDLRIQQIKNLSSMGKLRMAKNEAYLLLKEFQNVRECFTADDYDLDALIVSYDAYESVHKIIHNEMMGLYEWNEFIWFIDQLKLRTTEMEIKFEEQMDNFDNVRMKNAFTKLSTCLKTLDESLGDAYRPDFELPCNDLRIAFADLFKAYIKRIDI